jgi:hypothetical protein
LDGFDELECGDVALVGGVLVGVSVVVGVLGDVRELDCLCVPELPLHAADVVTMAHSIAAVRRRRLTGRTP